MPKYCEGDTVFCYDDMGMIIETTVEQLDEEKGFYLIVCIRDTKRYARWLHEDDLYPSYGAAFEAGSPDARIMASCILQAARFCGDFPANLALDVAIELFRAAVARKG